MNKILLVKPAKNYWFPLGYAYLAAAWKQAGIDFDFVDLDKDQLDLIEKYISKNDYTAICAGGLIASYSSIKDIMSVAEKVRPSLPRLVGGPLANNVPMHYLFDDIGANFVNIGEGEETTVELFHHIDQHGTAPSPLILGTAWPDKNNPQGFSVAPPRPKLDLEKIIEPDYSFWDYDWHKENGSASIPWNLMPILTGRGCIGGCAFCSPPSGAYRKRAPESVVAEIRNASQFFDANQIIFADEMFFNDTEAIVEFCRLYKEAGIPFTWACSMRVDGPLEHLQLMREHGCTNIYFGFESTNNRVLSAMKKRTTHQMQKKAIAEANKAGIYWQALWMAGNFSETQDELKESFSFFKKHHQTCPALLITYPGTLNYVRARKMGIIKDELKYIKALGDAFIGPIFQRLTKFIHNDLPYLNITDMDTDTLFKTYCSEVSLLAQAMEVTNPKSVIKENGELQVTANCPHCGNQVALIAPPGQPFNIHHTRCPHCNPMWLNISPLKLDVFKEQMTSTLLQRLKAKQHIIILDDNENAAFFFIMKNHLGLREEQIAGFIRTNGFSTKNIFFYPVVEVKDLPGETDCVLVVANTKNTKNKVRELRTALPSRIDLIDLSK
ncbi:B12-binding domain-containing radical SAM protein [Maridesulfovibrio sp.]|uniref:B12-binding domain-containing radical SAM protein n=1 Tax=Maridesulfovibrio sp. TaxID=2795000 RepID=UPI0039F0BAC3